MDYDFNCYDSLKHNRFSQKSNTENVINLDNFKLLRLKT